MPEAAVNEDRRVQLGQNYVRASGELAEMESEPEPALVQKTPDSQFWTGVHTANAGHKRAALGLRQDISHSKQPVPRAWRLQLVCD